MRDPDAQYRIHEFVRDALQVRLTPMMLVRFAPVRTPRLDRDGKMTAYVPPYAGPIRPGVGRAVRCADGTQ